MVPKYFQTDSTDILATIRQSILGGDKPAPVPRPGEEESELPMATQTKKAVIATAASLIDICSKYMSPSDIERIREAYRYDREARRIQRGSRQALRCRA